MLHRIKAALKSVGVPVFHFFAAKQTDKYIVWAEDGEAGNYGGDNRTHTQVLTGTVDYYTRAELDPNFDAIQSALNNADVAWKLNSIQREDKTGYIHYEWVFEGVAKVG